MDWDLFSRIALPVIYGAAFGIMWASNRRLRQRVQAIEEQALGALNALALMEDARDPSREVQDRLAQALEARLIFADGPDARQSRAMERRAAAQAMAASFIEDIQRANLRLVPDDDADVEAAR